MPMLKRWRDKRKLNDLTKLWAALEQAAAR
jgi:hypothetical protein